MATTIKVKDIPDDFHEIGVRNDWVAIANSLKVGEATEFKLSSIQTIKNKLKSEEIYSNLRFFSNGEMGYMARVG